MFAALPPGGKLARIEIRTPRIVALSPGLAFSVIPNAISSCGIVVDGQPYHWRDGEAVLTRRSIHCRREQVRGRHGSSCSATVERPLTNPIITGLNRLCKNTLMRASQTQNVAGEKVGMVNKIFSVVYHASRRQAHQASQQAHLLHDQVDHFGGLLYWFSSSDPASSAANGIARAAA